jgi:hypothetical protein
MDEWIGRKKGMYLNMAERSWTYGRRVVGRWKDRRTDGKINYVITAQCVY